MLADPYELHVCDDPLQGWFILRPLLPLANLLVKLRDNIVLVLEYLVGELTEIAIEPDFRPDRCRRNDNDTINQARIVEELGRDDGLGCFHAAHVCCK